MGGPEAQKTMGKRKELRPFAFFLPQWLDSGEGFVVHSTHNVVLTVLHFLRVGRRGLMLGSEHIPCPLLLP